MLSRSDDPGWGVAALCCHRPPGTTRLARSWRCSLIPTRKVLARPSARLSQRACCLKNYSLVKEHRAAGVKLLPAPAREGFSGLGAPQFTTDIFSAKSRACICKHSVNERQQSVNRRCYLFCFYGIAAAGLRHTNGDIGVTISKARPERFSSSTLATISKTLLGHFCK